MARLLVKTAELALTAAVTAFIHVHYVLVRIVRALTPADFRRTADSISGTWELSGTRFLLILLLANTGIWISQIQMMISGDRDF